MLFKSLKETYEPEPQITVFELHKTCQKFINQTIQVYIDFLQNGHESHLADDICRAYYLNHGEEPIQPGYGFSLDEMYNMMKSLKDDDFLDFIHISLQVMGNDIHVDFWNYKAFITDLNEIFRKNAIGYTVSEKCLIPILDKELHDLMVIPTLATIDSKKEVVKKELENSLNSYKEGKYRECIHSSCNAVESSIKHLCVESKIVLPSKLDLGNLIKHLSTNGYFSNYDEPVQNKIVESVCIIGGFRNMCGGHGPNPSGGTVDEPLARYVLFLSMTVINFLCTKK